LKLALLKTLYAEDMLVSCQFPCCNFGKIFLQWQNDPIHSKNNFYFMGKEGCWCFIYWPLDGALESFLSELRWLLLLNYPSDSMLVHCFSECLELW